MNNEDISDVAKNLSSMLDGVNIPDNIRELLNNMQSSNNSNTSANFSNSTATSNCDNTTNNVSSDSNIDMDTILKISKIVSQMNNTTNDARANLLLSLKPYLKDSRKGKLEQYVKLLNMSKVLEIINPNGSENVK